MTGSGDEINMIVDHIGLVRSSTKQTRFKATNQQFQSRLILLIETVKLRAVNIQYGYYFISMPEWDDNL
jgi:hypothetical protein